MQKYFHCGMITIGLLSTLPISVAENVAETELPVVGEGDSGKRPGSDEVRLQRMLITSISSAHLVSNFSLGMTLLL